jgi:ketosteroid isomerase-like protein
MDVSWSLRNPEAGLSGDNHPQWLCPPLRFADALPDRPLFALGLKKHEDAYNKYDAAAYAALYTPDAIEVLSWQSESGATVGQQAIEKMAAAEFASFPAKQSFTLVQVYAIGSEICAISEFIHYRLGGKGYAVTIYVREGDDWKIRMVYANWSTTPMLRFASQ